MSALPEGITQLLVIWEQGDEAALNELICLVYPELRRMARRQMRGENQGHTLQTSALINEAYLRLADQKSSGWEGRGHFFATAARMMRHILVDHARRYRYAKRVAGAQHVPLDDLEVPAEQRAAEIADIDEALSNLAAIDERKAKIVELRFFGGLSVQETAEVLNVSPVTIMREWRLAKAWLYRQMSHSS